MTDPGAAEGVIRGMISAAPAVLMIVLSAGTALGAEPVSPSVSERVDFNRDIRPILTDRCFNCHGPDSRVTELTGGLRLDSFEGATAARDGGVIPIVPGEPAASEVIRRVRSVDPDVRMPPPDSNLTVSDHEADLLERWIAGGGEYDIHWSFKPIESSPVPEDTSGWSTSEIDRFIHRALTTRGIEPSPRADRETLIRRLSLDLTGLPPTPAEIDGYLADDDPGSS
ncbi:MAG: DUF1549 domain-containing protein, partial [Phycisphaerales bacterium]|nr:DUF1549 domain-containing protein [Phycisphaerales bacterium]